MKFILLFVCASFLLACGNSDLDPKMCDCLEAGEKLNDFSASMFQKEVSDADVEQMKKLKAEKKRKCANFQTMSGEEMLKKKAACAEQ